MAGSPKRAARKSSRVKKSPDTAIKMIVRRGATPRFEALKKKTEHLNVEVVWDRRGDHAPDDAAAAERERDFKNRRGEPPFTWDAADFVVVVPKVKRAKRPK